jgi:uncharacterized repeat protein (TIGR01451 family)
MNKNKTNLILTTVLMLSLVSAAWAGPQIKVISKTLVSSHEWDDGVEVVPEATLTYRIVFKNTGDAPAKDAVITDAIPKGTTFVLKSLKASFNGDKAYFDEKAKKWNAVEPKNPNRVQKIKYSYKGTLAPEAESAWVEYSVKVNY